MDFLEYPDDPRNLPYWKVGIGVDEQEGRKSGLDPDADLSDEIFIPREDYGDNLVDASIIGSDLDDMTEMPIVPWFYQAHELKKVDIPEIKPNMRVVKIGARTGYTEGRVNDPSYGYSLGPKVFLDQILSTIPVDSGDSGSVLLNENHCPIGLVFAKIREGLCLANKLSNLDSEFKKHHGVGIHVYAPREGCKKDIELELEKLHENDHDSADYSVKMEDLE